MANYNTIVVPTEGLTCTEGEANDIGAHLYEADQGEEPHGFRFDYEQGDGYLIAEENGNLDNLPKVALDMIAAIISRNGEPFWEFGVAFTCSRMIAGAFGGTAFRIYPDGTIVNRTETWVER
jgi:hypothetical protein